MSAIRSIPLTNLPCVGNLKAALIGVVQGRIDEVVQQLDLNSTDKARRIAISAVRLSEKKCFFCNSDEASKQNKKFTGKDGSAFWTKYTLCPCLTPWVGAYQKLLPWNDNLSKFVAEVNSGQILTSTIAYRARCIEESCKAVFNITAGTIAYRFGKYKTATGDGLVARSVRCKKCALALQTKLSADSGPKKKYTKAARPPKTPFTVTPRDNMDSHGNRKDPVLRASILDHQIMKTEVASQN